MNIRKYLNELYLDYVNDYLTVAKFAEHNLISVAIAEKLIECGRVINQQGVDFQHDIAALDKVV